MTTRDAIEHIEHHIKELKAAKSDGFYCAMFPHEAARIPQHLHEAEGQLAALTERWEQGE